MTSVSLLNRRLLLGILRPSRIVQTSLSSPSYRPSPSRNVATVVEAPANKTGYSVTFPGLDNAYWQQALEAASFQTPRKKTTRKRKQTKQKNHRAETQTSKRDQRDGIAGEEVTGDAGIPVNDGTSRGKNSIPSNVLEDEPQSGTVTQIKSEPASTNMAQDGVETAHEPTTLKSSSLHNQFDDNKTTEKPITTSSSQARQKLKKTSTSEVKKEEKKTSISTSKNKSKKKAVEEVPDQTVTTTPPKPKRPQWQLQKEALKRKLGDEGWNPRKKLSPDTLDGIRDLHERFPDKYTTPVLAREFQVSAEAIRRILKSRWQPDDGEREERRKRWARRHDRIWDMKAQLGLRPPRKKDRQVEDPDAFEEGLQVRELLRNQP